MYVALNLSAPLVDLVTCWTVSPINSSVYGADCLAQEEREVTLTNLKKEGRLLGTKNEIKSEGLK